MKNFMIQLAVALASSGAAMASPCDTLRDALTTRTLTADRSYVLEGMVKIENGQVLTIDPNVTICAMPGSGLVIEKSGRLYANGTAGNMITFTSAQPAGLKAPGDWTGIVFIGDAGNNKPADLIQRGALQYRYGGTDDTYSGGIMRYVSIEYAGQVTGSNTHNAALVAGALGSATVMEYIQVLESGSDGIRLLGGMNNLSHIYIQNAHKNDISIAYGYRGAIQELLAVKNTRMRTFDINSAGISVINNELSSTATPHTFPLINSFTLAGPQQCGSLPGDRSAGLFFDHNSAGTFENGVVSGFDHNIVIQDNLSASRTATDLTLRYLSIGNAGTQIADFRGSAWTPCGADIINWLQTDPCGTSGNIQYSAVVQDYHTTICDDYCDNAPVFQLGQSTEISKREDLEQYAGALQDIPVFTWVNTCPAAGCCANTLRTWQSLECYPNPARHTVTLTVPATAGTAHIRVIHIHTGRLVYQAEVSAGNIDLDIAHYPAGNYLVQVQTPDTVYQGIVQKSE